MIVRGNGFFPADDDQLLPPEPGNSPFELLVAQLLLQAIWRQMAEDRRKVLLWDGFTVLTKSDVGFLIGPPCSPMRKTWTIGISELCEVSPIGLHGGRELVVRRCKWQPAKVACLKRVEDVRKFQCMEGPEG
jgi:hypothetical protein